MPLQLRPGYNMAVKTMSSNTTKALIPPEETAWEKYSRHFEMPLASATSLFLHGTIIGIMAIGGMAFFWAASQEAARPPKMDVVMLEGDGSGLEGLAGEPGLPGPPDAGAPRRTEQVTLQSPPNQPERSAPRKDAPIELELPFIDDSKAPLNPQVSIELERIAKEAQEQAQKELKKPSAQADSGSDKRNTGPRGTGKLKGQGGLGGSGGGLGMGNRKGAGVGKGGIGPGNATKQEVYAWRWNFDLSGNAKEHARKLASIGVNIAVQNPKGQVFFITDLNRRPVPFEPGNLPDPKKVVSWRNTKQDSIGALAQELQLSFMPVFVQMLLPKEREEKMAAEEERFAIEQRRDLKTVRRTWFEFRLRNGAYEPVAVRFE
jgi:hypothetical protein